jgi:hypothetical protein
MEGQTDKAFASGKSASHSAENRNIRGKNNGIRYDGLWSEGVNSNYRISIGVADNGHIRAEKKGFDQFAHDPDSGTSTYCLGHPDVVASQSAFDFRNKWDVLSFHSR